MRLLFVRHGDPCKTTYGLTKKGEEEVKLLANYFKENKIIEKAYTSTAERATETTRILKKYINVNVEEVAWLQEFKYSIVLPNGERQFPWEITPSLWIQNGAMFDFKKCLEDPIYKSGSIKERCVERWDEFDRVLEKYGYKRYLNYYNVKNANKKTLLFISHFATISVLLSHLLNIPLSIVMHMFWCSPSSYTELRSEEIECGKALFRCITYGNLSHLAGINDLKSFYGLQKEVFMED